MMPALNWVADAVLALLLLGSLCMSFRLERALRVIRRDRSAFETLITNLGSATNAVKIGIEALRVEAQRAAEHIDRRSEEADKMATDLSFLIEAADRAGNNLEQRLDNMSTRATESMSSLNEAVPQVAPASIKLEESSNPASGGLRQLAGITTKRHSRAGDVNALKPAAATGRELATIKLAG